jgi:hypothetical protein
MIVEAVTDAPHDAKSDLVWVLLRIWLENGDGRAQAALYRLLGDSAVDFQIAIAFAQEDDAAGADVLRAVAAQNPAAYEGAQYDAQEARYWLEELGLDMAGAPRWTDTVPVGIDGLAILEGRIEDVRTGDGSLRRLWVSVPGMSEALIVTVPWNARVLSSVGESVELSAFLQSASGHRYNVRISAEDVAGFPWAVTIELLEPL